MQTFLQDLRFALRVLRKNPGFTAVAVLTLALGIGANTAIFSVTNAVLLRFLPVPHPERLVYLHYLNQPSGSSQTGFNDFSLSEPVFEELRKQRQVFSDVVAFVPFSFRKTTVRYGEEPEEAAVDMVSGNFFSGLGVNAARGRTFSLEDESQHTQTAVLSYNYWTRRFARNTSVIDTTIYVRGVPFTIVGVAARDFLGVEPVGSTDLWMTFQIAAELKPWGVSPTATESLYGAPDWWFLMMIGRLAPGVSQQQALAQLNPIYAHVAYAGTKGPPPNEPPPQLYFTPARGIASLRQAYGEPLKVLMVMVGVVLAIACANVAMLVVARNTARYREFSLRAALGAGRVRLFRQLLTESLLLVAAGGVAGWVFAAWASQALGNWAELNTNLGPDWMVLLFSLAISCVAALAFGLAPLRIAVRVPPALALRTSAASASETPRRFRAGQAVVALQMALCLVLLAGAGLLVRTLRNLETANLGLHAQGLLVFGVTPPHTVRTDAETVLFYQRLMNQLRALPGVESATLMQNRPGAGTSNNTILFVDGVQPSDKIRDSLVRWNAVGPDCFHVLGVPILLGRDFTDADSSTSAKIAIVNQIFVERYLAGRHPIAHHISLDEVSAPQYTIVGVVENNKYTGVRERPVPMAYFPFTQVPEIASMQIELRTRGNPLRVLPEARRVVREFGPDLPLQQPMTQQAQFEASFNEEHLLVRLAFFFGLLAALLVGVGLYGTLAYRVSRRTAEIGVRMALGAQPRQVLWMISRESAAVSIAGILVGLPLAFGAARLLQSQLFGLAPGDPLSFCVAVVGIGVIAFLAAAIPARRATKVDPIVALRFE